MTGRVSEGERVMRHTNDYAESVLTKFMCLPDYEQRKSKKEHFHARTVATLNTERFTIYRIAPPEQVKKQSVYRRLRQVCTW